MPPPFAVTPAFIIPVAILAMFAAGLVTWALGALRRWWPFLNIAIACSALYVVRFTFKGVVRRLDARDDWWAKPWAFWVGVAAVLVAGAAWYSRRRGADKPATTEKVVLSAAGVAAAGAAGLWLGDEGSLPDLLWVASITVWTGAVFALTATRLGEDRLATPGVMLGAAALACAAVAVSGLGW